MTSRRSIKWLRVSVIILVIILLITGIGGSIASHYLKRQILNKLPAIAAKATDSLYKVSVGDLRINVFTGEVTVYGLRLSLDSSVFEQKKAANQLPPMLLNLYVPETRLGGLKWKNALKEAALSCRSAVLERPEISVWLTGSSYQKKQAGQSALSEVRANSITIISPRIIVDGSAQNAFEFSTGGGEVIMRDWKYLPGRPDKSRFYNAESITVSLDSLDFRQQGSYYAMSSGQLHFNSDSNFFSMQALAFAPVISYDSVYRVIGHRSTIYNFYTDAVSIRGFDWRAFFYAAKWRAAQVSLISPSLGIYYSKVPPPAIVPRNGAFPDDIIQRLGHQLYVPYVVINNGAVSYTSQDDRTLREGAVTFNNMDGVALHLTNDSTIPPAKTYLMVKGTLFGRSPFGLGLGFSTGDSDGHFSIIGTLANLKADEVSQPAEVMGMASVKSMLLRRMDMAVSGNKDSAEGDFEYNYDRLRIKLQQFDTATSRIKGRNVLSFMANNVFLFPANPMPGEALRPAHTVVYRDDGQPFFSLMWKVIFNSVLETALRDRDMLARFRERRAKHLVKKLQKKTIAELDSAFGR